MYFSMIYESNRSFLRITILGSICHIRQAYIDPLEQRLFIKFILYGNGFESHGDLFF